MLQIMIWNSKITHSSPTILLMALSRFMIVALWFKTTCLSKMMRSPLKSLQHFQVQTGSTTTFFFKIRAYIWLWSSTTFSDVSIMDSKRWSKWKSWLHLRLYQLMTFICPQYHVPLMQEFLFRSFKYLDGDPSQWDNLWYSADEVPPASVPCPFMLRLLILCSLPL